jgi:hypothetical protein
MSGRTGGAYAAEIASMQGSNELDALRVLGIPLQGLVDAVARTLGKLADSIVPDAEASCERAELRAGFNPM